MSRRSSIKTKRGKKTRAGRRGVSSLSSDKRLKSTVPTGKIDNKINFGGLSALGGTATTQRRNGVKAAFAPASEVGRHLTIFS